MGSIGGAGGTWPQVKWAQQGSYFWFAKRAGIEAYDRPRDSAIERFQLKSAIKEADTQSSSPTQSAPASSPSLAATSDAEDPAMDSDSSSRSSALSPSSPVTTMSVETEELQWATRLAQGYHIARHPHMIYYAYFWPSDYTKPDHVDKERMTPASKEEEQM